MAIGALTPPAPGAGRQLRGLPPEIYFVKHIDNSRLVKVRDPQRTREMGMFLATTALLFLLVMIYAWQHFSAVEYGYRIEQQRFQRDNLVEMNRALHLEEASLRDPQRIDLLARQLRLAPPQAGQVVRLDVHEDAGGPVMARVSDAVRGLATAAAQ